MTAYGNSFIPKTSGSLKKYLDLYNEFSVFNFDSAYFYSNKLQEAAFASKDSLLLKYAKIKSGFTLLSSGMFKEVFDSLNYLNPNGLDDFRKAEYYIFKSRSYSDLSDYNQGKVLFDLYSAEADKYIDSLLTLSSLDSFQLYYYNGLRNLRKGDTRKATGYFSRLVANSSLSLHQAAIINSTYSDLFIRRGLPDSAIIYLSKAAIADIQSSTKETTAILNLATLLFKLGDVKNASVYIKKASEDAKIYGARQRIIQLSNILPLIEAERLSTMEKSKKSITRYAIIITLSFLLLIIFGFVIFKQVRRLKAQQKEIYTKNTSLRHLVDEKEWLLKEIHHRVKNNLHTITSLLESQSAYLENDALDAIRDSQHRVFAMSLIHQKLYQTEKNETSINMPVYLRELVDYLKESFESTRRIKFHMDTKEIELDISLAVPVGLILNEAITNAMKYAFPGDRSGDVEISIKRTSERKLLFAVADNGIGLPDGFDPNNINSLGMKLMKGLSTDIMAGFRVENLNGTTISIEFAPDKSLAVFQHSANPKTST